MTSIIPIHTFSHLSALPGIRHFQTTRAGGVSTGVFTSLNLGLHNGDTTAHVRTNRQLLANALGLPPEAFTLGNQVHGTHIEIVTENHRGRGAHTQATALPDTDAMICHQPGICLIVLTADCVPVLLYDPTQRVIAAVHAGKKGTAGRITQKTILRMQETFGCQPDDILAGIGPSIGPCCYETDLWEANRQQLLDAGVRDTRIETSGICTSCHTAEYFSYRKEQGHTGRMATGIMLRRDS